MEKREIYVVVCSDGQPHPGRQALTLEEAKKRIMGIGVPLTGIDDWSHPCGPHKIQKFVSEGDSIDPKKK